MQSHFGQASLYTSGCVADWRKVLTPAVTLLSPSPNDSTTTAALHPSPEEAKAISQFEVWDEGCFHSFLQGFMFETVKY